MSTSRPAASASAPRLRCSARSRRYVDAHFGVAGLAPLHRASSATPSSTRATSGRRSPSRSPGPRRRIWIVDLNRQSLDRVVPGVRADRLEAMFSATGWHVIEVKYGPQLRAVFERPGGESLRRHLDEMPNEQYQAMLRQERRRAARALPHRSRPGGPARARRNRRRRARRCHHHPRRPRLRATCSGCSGEAERSRTAAVMFAYTVKGWGLPFAGDRPQPRRPPLAGPDRRSARRAVASHPDASGTCRSPGSPEQPTSRRLAKAAGRGAADRRRRARRAEAPGPPTARGGGSASRPPDPCRPRRFSAGSCVELASREELSTPTSSPSTPDVADLDQPGRLGQQAVGVFSRQVDSRTSDDGQPAAALARVAGGPPHRARDLRDEPLPAARPARSWRHDLSASRCSRSARSTTRSSSAASTRSMLQPLLGRPLRDRRHARPGSPSATRAGRTSR